MSENSVKYKIRTMFSEKHCIYILQTAEIAWLKKKTSHSLAIGHYGGVGH